ncbi:alpha/beta hydrolase [Kribbella sp. NBC_01245]|uniref:alpha/beta fold hydrolase n=1 Tax=Kribbella sp. NBC_01245 TaxID=2903578 RepID=UPI002E2DEBC6|nr:alpha/beta fold hydrolase [Kribbella sp. NBC_01245]
MRRPSRRLPATLLAAAVVVPLLTTGTTAIAATDAAELNAARGPKSPVVPKINWKSCGDKPELKAFQCATVEVPTDYDKPRGATTTIALTRLPASDQAHKVGTLFTNFGGPGGPGVETLRQIGQVGYTAKVRARFDVLGFDPRGVGLSDPATCFPTAAEENAFWAGKEAFPLTKEQERENLISSIQLARSCAKTSPDRLAHFSTANVARDMDLLRQAVGDEKLSYIGYSYGTYLGATYAKLFPNNVRALVLDGTLQPEWYSASDGSKRTPIGVRLKQGEGGHETFAEFNRQCKAAGPAQCVLAGLGDPATVAERTLQRLKTKPVVLTLPDGTKVPISYQTAVMNTFFGLYDPIGYPDLAEFLAVVSLASEPAQAKRSAGAVSESLQRWIKRMEEYTSVGSSLQFCVESPATGKPLAYGAAADAADKVAPHFGRARSGFGLMCEFLPIRDHDDFRGPWKQQTKEPVLVIGTKYDPATPYSATKPYARFWPNARTVTVNGWGHTTLFKSQCADRLITDYLVDRKAPADGTNCEQDRKPFDPLPTAAKQLPVLGGF